MKYDFIEIGTSDFDTLIQSTQGLIGLSIEPIQLYLDNLPDNDRVIKVNCAVSDVEGEIDIWMVEPEDIQKHGLPEWIRGCNSVFVPHRTVETELQTRGLMGIYKCLKVKCLSWETLVKTYDIKEVSQLKIDTEGHDYVIVNAVLKAQKVYPRTILFECNGLTPLTEVHKTVEALKSAGYRIVTWTDTDILAERLC